MSGEPEFVVKPLDLELLALGAGFLEDRTVHGDLTLPHGYAMTVHVAQGLAVAAELHAVRFGGEHGRLRFHRWTVRVVAYAIVFVTDAYAYPPISLRA